MSEELDAVQADSRATGLAPVARDAFDADVLDSVPSSHRFASVLAPAMAIASMCSVQLGAALSRPATIEYGTLSTTWLRLCFAALVLAIVVRPPLHTYSRQRWIAAFVLGSAMAGMTLCFFEAVQRVPLGLAVAINFLGPLCVATVGIRKFRMLAWPVLAMAGVVLLARQDGMWTTSFAALVFPIGSALGWATYIVMMKRVGTLFDGLQGLSTSLIVAALVTTPFGLAQSGGHLPAAQLFDAAYLAVLVPLLPYVLEMIALRRMTASAFGILMSAEPAIAAAIGFVVLGQPMTGLQSIGTLLVVSASIGAVVQK
ncbi:putative threonine and homoserine efflux protein (rhtA-like) [Paraburkholderia ribeironis]|uniref:Putative threonine and homoserine efflux protein (RhtA-like) n=1 Tax=Paraburkholderia ribeironis TaxID=1247936 RepID=A0A1N7SGP7_9BURK|nr:EamA family transporter [Paraburkholderia ribeironis]SIT46559.1 putative threonine and homoserine efflux protein (rhtA-like) [Paraburkholderia ribeironis]